MPSRTVRKLPGGPDWLRQQYATKSAQEIATEIGVHRHTVLAWLRRFAIPLHPKGIHLKGRPKAPSHRKRIGAAQRAFVAAASPEQRAEHGRRVSLAHGGTGERTTRRVVRVDGRRRFEHRAIMEAHLGRALQRDEHVHHIDGNPLNNDLANLTLVSPTEHHRIHHPTLRFPKTCEHCGATFIVKPSTAHQRGCSRSCAQRLSRQRDPT